MPIFYSQFTGWQFYSYIKAHLQFKVWNRILLLSVRSTEGRRYTDPLVRCKSAWTLNTNSLIGFIKQQFWLLDDLGGKTVLSHFKYIFIGWQMGPANMFCAKYFETGNKRIVKNLTSWYNSERSKVKEREDRQVPIPHSSFFFVDFCYHNSEVALSSNEARKTLVSFWWGVELRKSNFVFLG